MTEKHTTRTPAPAVESGGPLMLPPPLDEAAMAEVATSGAMLRAHVARSLGGHADGARLLEAVTGRVAAAHAATCPEPSCPVLSAVLAAAACDARTQTMSAELMLGAAFALDANDALAALAAVVDAVPCSRGPNTPAASRSREPSGSRE